MARIQKHSIRIYISLNLDTLTEYHHDGGKGATVLVTSCLVLARDISAFCQAIRTPMVALRAKCLSLSVQKNEPVNLFFQGHPRATPPSFKFELVDTNYRQLDRALQHLLLEPFADVISSSLRTRLLGSICDHVHVATLGAVMGPELVCVEAIGWAS